MNHWHCDICDRALPEEAERCDICEEISDDGPRLTQEGASIFWLSEDE